MIQNIVKRPQRIRQHIFSLAACSLLIFSCEHADLSVELPNENLRPAADFVNNNFEMTLFSAALRKVGLYEDLNTGGPYTLLVPSDVAFNEVGIFRAADFDRLNKDSLKRVISYHILPQRLRNQDIPINSADVRYKTLEGLELFATNANYGPDGFNVADRLYFSGAQAIRKDITLANGVLYSLNKLMKPQFEVTVDAWLEVRPEYSVFISGLKKFGLWETVKNAKPITVFAPTNDALEKIGITESSLSAMNPNEYYGELLLGCYFIKNKHFFAADAEAFNTIASKGGYLYLAGDKVRGISLGFVRFLETLGYSLTLYSIPSYTAGRIEKTIQYDVKAKTDYLCSNGVVHDLDQGFVTLDMAKKN